MLDLQMLKTMPHGTKFATGTAPDNEGGLNMSNSGKLLRWVAIRGGGGWDWAIYYGPADTDIDAIAKYGDKVVAPCHIRLCVPCDNIALGHYRR